MSRLDDQGNPCPGTLGEYRDLWAALTGDDSKAVAFLDQKIQEQGRDMEVIAPDSQMMVLLGHFMSEASR